MKYSNNRAFAVGKDRKIPFPVFTLGLRSTGMSYQGRASSSETFQSTLRGLPGMTQGRNWLSDSQKKGWLGVVTERALPDPSASGLSSSKCFVFPLSVVMAAFGKGEIGKKKEGKKGSGKRRKVAECGMLPAFASGLWLWEGAGSAVVDGSSSLALLPLNFLHQI